MLGWEAHVQAAQRAANGQMIRVGGDDGLHVEFCYEAVLQSFESQKENRPIYKDVEFIKMFMPGGKSEVFEEVTDYHRQRFAKQYNGWLQSGKTPVDGYPLKLWPALTPAQVATLGVMNVHTVEQLANASDIVIQQYGPGGQNLREQAQTYLAAAKDGAPLRQLTEENQRLREDLDMMRQQLAELSEKLREKKAK